MLESVWERLRAFGCKQTEHILYWISIWCVLGVGLVYIAAFYIAHVTGNDQLLQCKMKLYFGIPCPGCGGTRAIWSLLHGRVLQAVYYNGSYQNGDYQNGGYQNGSYQNGGYQNNSYQNNGYNGQPQYNYQGNNSPGRGYSIACLILGICGIVFCFCYGIVGVICSIVALVLHGKAVELDGFESSYAKAGKICAIIGIVIGVIYLILTILAVVFSMSVGGLSTILRA